MSFLQSLFRYIRTLGGVASNKMDERTEDLMTSPAGIKSAFAQTREDWKKQYREVRDAVAQLLTVADQKREEIRRLEKELEELEVKKRGAIVKYQETNDTRYQQAFQEAFSRQNSVTERLTLLQGESKELEEKLELYKKKLHEMQDNIARLDRQEAEAIADIVSSQQIVALNDRLANVSVDLKDRNLQAIERARQKAKAKAHLTTEMAENPVTDLDKELIQAGMNQEAQLEFQQMLQLAEQEKKKLEAPKEDSN